MKIRYAQLLALALAGTMFAPAALADRGHQDRSKSGVVIYLGTGHGSQIHATRSWKPNHRYSKNTYRQGYRDGYRAGLHAPQRRPHHKSKGPQRRPGHAQALPPGHYRPVPGHKVHLHR